MTTALEGVEVSASRPGRSLPPVKTRYQLYRRLGGPQGRSEQVRKISPSPGFDPRTVHPVASRYTDWATWPTLIWMINNKTSLLLRSSADTYKAPLEATLTSWLLLSVSEMDRVADVTPVIVWHLCCIRNWSNKRAFYVSVSHNLHQSVLHFISACIIVHCFSYYITYQDFLYFVLVSPILW